MADNVSTMLRAVDFVEHNLKADIRVADVAEAVSYSLYHFCRVFNQIIHHTPYDYIVRRRLSESARDLVETDRRIIDIAYEYGFGTPETFSRAFKRMFGVQPHQWRKREHIDNRTLLPRLTRAHVEHINKGDYLVPALCTLGALRLAGVMTPVRGDEGTILQAWAMLEQELPACGGEAAAWHYYGVAHYPREWQQRGYLYLAAVDAPSLDISRSGLVSKSLPPATYARFVHKGTYGEARLTRDYVYQTWLPKSGCRLAGRYEVERFGQRTPDLEGATSECEIHVPIEPVDS